MKKLKLSDYLSIIKPEYIYLKLTPNISIRNQSTHKIARAIASLYKNMLQNIKKEQAKSLKFFKKELGILKITQLMKLQESHLNG